MMQIDQHASKNVAKILIGNKCDITESKVVSYERGKELADEFSIEFFETSAKSNINVNETFQSMARQIKNFEMDTQPKGVNLNSINNKNIGDKEKKCCK